MLNLFTTNQNSLFSWNPITGVSYLGLKENENPLPLTRAQRRKRTNLKY